MFWRWGISCLHRRSYSTLNCHRSSSWRFNCVRSEGALSDTHVSVFLEEAATFILYPKFIHRATQPVILEDQNIIFTTLTISCCNIIIFNITGCSYNKMWIPTAVGSQVPHKYNLFTFWMFMFELSRFNHLKYNSQNRQINLCVLWIIN